MDDPGPGQPGATGEMTFDVGVFKSYLTALLPPGMSSRAVKYHSNHPDVNSHVGIGGRTRR